MSMQVFVFSRTVVTVPTVNHTHTEILHQLKLMTYFTTVAVFTNGFNANMASTPCWHENWTTGDQTSSILPCPSTHSFFFFHYFHYVFWPYFKLSQSLFSNGCWRYVFEVGSVITSHFQLEFLRLRSPDTECQNVMPDWLSRTSADIFQLRMRGKIL